MRAWNGWIIENLEAKNWTKVTIPATDDITDCNNRLWCGDRKGNNRWHSSNRNRCDGDLTKLERTYYFESADDAEAFLKEVNGSC